ncbi:VWA domain-containing protein [Aerococcaceae bacterium DSM 111176]|nr:VWA domain-containing protein [Aerococcaceae bacterium DSM 111176]
MKKGLTEVVFILDKSGSMSGLESDTIGGYNSMLNKQRSVEGECIVTTVLFDNYYELLHDRIDIRAVSDITENEYQVGGSTALIDAIGRTINKIANAQKHTTETFRAESVMFVIITDGAENSSREYTTRQIKNLIEKQKEEFGWEFIFLGANIDSVETAGQFGINSDRAVDYLADSEGTKLNYEIIAEAVTTFREEGVVDEALFEEIRQDAKQRGARKI